MLTLTSDFPYSWTCMNAMSVRLTRKRRGWNKHEERSFVRAKLNNKTRNVSLTAKWMFHLSTGIYSRSLNQTLSLILDGCLNDLKWDFILFTFIIFYFYYYRRMYYNLLNDCIIKKKPSIINIYGINLNSLDILHAKY